MSECPEALTHDSADLRAGIALAWFSRRPDWEATVLRMIRIALIAFVPLVAMSLSIAGCGDDTTSTGGGDLAAPTGGDMAKSPSGDMATTD
jgi:hypothetical protein